MYVKFRRTIILAGLEHPKNTRESKVGTFMMEVSAAELNLPLVVVRKSVTGARHNGHPQSWRGQAQL